MLPPFLAGREGEQALIRSRLARLASDATPGTFVILHGPRGNGKTTLLVWAKRQAEARRIRVINIRLGESDRPQEASRLARGAFQWLRAVSSFSIGGAGVNWREVPPRKLVAAIERKARRGPVLVTIDEAHTLPAKLGRALLSAGQRWQHSGPHAMLLLAGTPHLPEHLKSMRASFWERSRRLFIGRLGLDASIDAIRIPLEERERSISDDAAAPVAEESHGYPFFLQLWGELLWEASGDAGRKLSRADLDRVRPQFEKERDGLYLNRYRELARAKLLPVAESLAAVFARSERRIADEVVRAAREGLERSGRASDEDSAMDACDQLTNLGYICPTVHASVYCYEPGIPSLMRFVQLNERTRGAGPERSA